MVMSEGEVHQLIEDILQGEQEELLEQVLRIIEVRVANEEGYIIIGLPRAKQYNSYICLFRKRERAVEHAGTNLEKLWSEG